MFLLLMLLLLFYLFWWRFPVHDDEEDEKVIAGEIHAQRWSKIRSITTVRNGLSRAEKKKLGEANLAMKSV